MSSRFEFPKTLDLKPYTLDHVREQDFDAQRKKEREEEEEKKVEAKEEADEDEKRQASDEL